MELRYNVEYSLIYNKTILYIWGNYHYGKISADDVMSVS